MEVMEEKNVSAGFGSGTEEKSSSAQAGLQKNDSAKDAPKEEKSPASAERNKKS